MLGDWYDELLSVEAQPTIEPFERMREAMRRVAFVRAKEPRLALKIHVAWGAQGVNFHVHGRVYADGKLHEYGTLVTEKAVRTQSVCPLTLALGEVVQNLLIMADDPSVKQNMRARRGLRSLTGNVTMKLGRRPNT